MSPRQAARVDANQVEIVAEYRAMGASVQDLSAVGKGCPDIAVGFRGVTLFVEIKDGAKPPSQRKLTPHQVDWHAKWEGSVVVQTKVEECILILQEMKDGVYS